MSTTQTPSAKALQNADTAFNESGFGLKDIFHQHCNFNPHKHATSAVDVYPNFWQIGCTFDTIVDYIRVKDESGDPLASTEIDTILEDAIQAFNVGIVGLMAAWYDDWAWWGIACSKAFNENYETYFGNHAETFQQMALAMWDVVENGDYQAVIDFIPSSIWKVSANLTDPLEGHTYFTPAALLERHNLHTGTRNAWALIEQGADSKTATKQQQQDYHYFASDKATYWAKPRFGGGCWQYNFSSESFYSNDGPGSYWPDPNPKIQTLGVCQVTLMQGLYISFASSLALAAKRKEKTKHKLPGPWWDKLDSSKNYIAKAGAVVDFLNNWCQVGDQDALVKTYTDGSLMHERTPTYAEHTAHKPLYPPVNGYFSDAFWGGDQGLILGALQQYYDVSKTKDKVPEQADPLQLLKGVAYHMTDQDHVVQPYLDPSGNSPLSGDDSDYGSGSGIYWRYALLVSRLDPTLKSKAMGDDTVNQVVTASGTAVSEHGNELFRPFNSVAAGIAAWYMLK